MESIRSAIETACAHLTEHPEAAVSTDAAATAVREDGLRFRVEGPKGAVTTDMAGPVWAGGTGHARPVAVTRCARGLLRRLRRQAQTRGRARDQGRASR